MDPYISVADANEYFDTRINAETWEDADATEHLKALLTATRAIDTLPFIGEKNDKDQDHEWPRGGNDTPDGIMIACCEEALSLLEGRDPILEQENLRALSQTFANVKMAYDPRVIAEHINYGITSSIAWRYLKPYIVSSRTVSIKKV